MSAVIATPKTSSVMPISPRLLRLPLMLLLAGLASCGPKPTVPTPTTDVQAEHALLRVGSLAIDQADLDQLLKERYAGRRDDAARKQALDELAMRAQLVQAALDANLQRDPVARAELARVLANRYKEQLLFPKLKELAAPIAEPRLRELYQAQASRFHATDKRELAVLWLNPGQDKQREAQYRDKLTAAHAWYAKNSDLEKHPEKGFAELSIDYSEHQASRYKGGVIGWLERQSAGDEWTKAVAEIGFSLANPGDISSVIVRPEGVFLVRYMALKPATTVPFEAVAKELERAEQTRLKQKAEAEFLDALAAKYPAQRQP